MSSFKKKYYYDFKSVDKKSHTVEIWQDTSTAITATKVIGALDPFIVTLSGIENKLQPVRGTGADLGLFATSSMQYMDLYTANMLEYQVRHYINSQLNWCGFLDSELFSSDFSRQKNYSVAMTANDGFALLDRLYYVQSDGSHYTGMSTQFDILKLILQKLGLPWTFLYVALTTSITGITPAASETIFHKTYVLNSNFYDEDGEALTLREMLESILKPYGAFIFQTNGNLYITDINFLAGVEYTTKIYTATDFSFSGEAGLNKNIGDLASIGFASNSQNLNIVSGVNKEVVKYSPYASAELMSFDGNGDFTDVSNAITRGITNYRWTETEYVNSTTWNKYNGGKFMSLQGVDGDNVDVTDTYIDVSYYGPMGTITEPTHSFTYKKNLPFLIPTNDYKLKLEMSVYPRKSDNLNGTTIDASICYVSIVSRLQIGSKKYYYNSPKSEAAPGNSWMGVGETGEFIISVAELSTITGNDIDKYTPCDDKWTDLKRNTYVEYDTAPRRLDFLIPLSTLSLDASFLEFKIYGYKCNGWTTGVNVPVKDLRIKDFKLSIVDLGGNEVSQSDIEYVGYMNPQYKEEGSSIELIQGSNLNEFPYQRGGLLKNVSGDFGWITEWTRAGVTDNIENLLLRSFVGNYESKNIELSVKTKLMPTLFGYLTYDAYLSGKKFMPTSVTQDYANNSSELTMQEIFVDSLTINKTF